MTLDRIADELLGQYALTFDSADPTATNVPIDVDVKKKGVSVRAPRRLY